jgi:AcrR family transcriptional regulator
VPTKPAERAGRQWSSTEAVRAELLDAARFVFGKRGFAEASVTEVVERAGSSVGSLYHHFGSKTDLFLALWQRHHAEQRNWTERFKLDVIPFAQPHRLFGPETRSSGRG